MINTLISTAIQVLAFALIPSVVYLLSPRKSAGFFTYIGLVPSSGRAYTLGFPLTVVLATPILAITFIVKDFASTLTDPSTVSGKIREMRFGIEGAITILLIAIFKTWLSEELFFRGFVAKGLIIISNFVTGNFIRAVLFGGIHVLTFLNLNDNLAFLVLFIFVPTIGAYITTYINEKVGHGSIYQAGSLMLPQTCFPTV